MIFLNDFLKMIFNAEKNKNNHKNNVKNIQTH